MTALLRLSAGIDKITAFIGRSVSWLILVAVLVSAGNAIIRKMFDVSSNAWLELQWYLYGAVFLLAAAYTLQRNEHVRIDIATSGLSKRTRDWIDLLGHIFFLMPFCLLMVYLSWPYVMQSIGIIFNPLAPALNLIINPDSPFIFYEKVRNPEISLNAGGLVIWPAKLMILCCFTLLTAQGISEIIKRWAVIKDIIEDPTAQHELPPVVEELVSAADLETRVKNK